MKYILNDIDIKKILLEGEFNKEKYAKSLAIYSWAVKDVVDSYFERNKKNIDVIEFKQNFEKNKEKMCELISEFHLKQKIFNIEEKEFDKQMTELINNYKNKNLYLEEINLYLEFLENEYSYQEKDLLERKKAILNYPIKDFSLAYTTDGNWTKEFQVNINFYERKIIYLVNFEKVKEEVFDKEEFLNFLKYLEYDSLIAEFSDFEED